jgi:hypothetical protein
LTTITIIGKTEGISMSKEVTGTILMPKEGMSWKAFVQIAILIAMLTIGAVYGVTYRVTIGTPEVLTALNMQVGSTYSLISKDYSYVIACPLGDAAMYCLQNGTTGALDSYRNNKTLIQTYAIGNLTAGGGSVFIKDLAWNTSVSIPANVIVVESYSGVFTYRTASMAQHIPASSTDNITGSYIYLGSLTSDPVSLVVGEMWYNSVSEQFKAYNGSIIVLGAAGATGPAGPAGTANGLPYSYMVFNNATATYMVNGTTGSVDYQSTNITKVFQFAVGNMTSGGNIFISKSVQATVSTQIRVTNINNLNFIFEQGATLTADTNLNLAVMYFLSCNNTRITGATIDGNWANQNGGVSYPNYANGISLDGCYGCMVDYCTVRNTRVYGLVAFNSGLGAKGGQCSFEHNNVTNAQWDGIDAYVPNCNIRFNDVSASADVGIGTMGNFTVIEGNYVHDMAGSNGSSNGQWAIDLEGGAYYNASNCLVIDNIIDGCNVGIAVYTAGCVNNTISRNIIRNWADLLAYSYAIDIRANYFTVSENTIFGSYSGHGGGIILTAASYGTVTKNKMSVQYRGIRLESGSLNDKITENTIVTTGGYVGIEILSGANNAMVTINDISQTGDGYLLNQATGSVIHYNIGFITENTGSAVNATATTFSLTHGLASTPTFVSYSFNSTGITAASWTSTSSTITVTVTGMASANYTCYWTAIYKP